MSKYKASKDVQLHISGVPFTVKRELLAARSAKLHEFFKENPQEDLSHLLRDIPTTPKTFELVGRFCHGYSVTISAENVIHVACLANYLGMEECHSPNNLLKEALDYFEQKIITSWNESVRALKTTENPIILQQAGELGLVDACIDSIISKALDNPRLLGEPIRNPISDDDDENNGNTYRPNARRQLFALDWRSEDDLTPLSLQLYEPIVRGMIECQVPLEYVTASLYQYANKWVFSKNEMELSFEGRNFKREVIEAVERRLPNERGILPCTLLSQMLLFAVALEASSDCRNGFEIRIGKQLDQATVKDLLIPSQGYSKEEQYDTECVRRILKHFYHNYARQDDSGLISVADLIEDFLAEVASDIDLKKSSFISVAQMSSAASKGLSRSSDGIYKAVDIYLDKHRYLTESEREEICGLLDCNKMSREACEHAAQNERLPLRVVMQVLFVGQLQLRETITKEVQSSDDGLRKSEEEGEEEVKVEMEKMSSKVIELERECFRMRKEIKSGCCHRVKKEKVNVWKEMKRKFGCVSSLHDCNCHVKKKKIHPR